jgi:hypothetical protein
VTVRLFLTSGGQPITANGTVARVAGPHMGIHLENIALDASKRLQEFLLPLICSETHGQVDLDD